MTRPLLIALAAVLVVAATALFSLPAAWLTPLIEQQTGGRLTLGDPQGSVWQGSAFAGAAADPVAPVAPMLPGRFRWTLSPLLLLGIVDAHIDNPEALNNPLTISGSWNAWQLGPASLQLPAERLAAIGAPLNTLQPSGRMQLSWSALELHRNPNGIDIDGRMLLELTDIASALSPVKPLGAYRMQFDWHGARARLTLSTLSGPLQMAGLGAIVNGRLQFSGEAWAQPGQEQRLAILLNLLGQQRQRGNRNVVALEFQ
jgi:general secretion pathway protein N